MGYAIIHAAVEPARRSQPSIHRGGRLSRSPPFPLRFTSQSRFRRQQRKNLASWSPSDVGHLNAHATSTPVGDRGELAAIKSVFGTEPSLAISATKSATGHTLGAAGGIEAIFTIKALEDQLAPPTLNFEQPDEHCRGLDIVGRAARPASFEHAISNGFGFGGVNASVIFRRWNGA